ncbi:hypothetical protein L0B70_05370 [Kaistella sp. 97-N-M2]|uniref:hypothetical protein n=1 Tax=Kaistella sp. 97-N-M2 TaxID=2908645 RepID=UPI001F2AB7BC|nr:hypothetical protein [Kaistella sp. 97-N-M2]UJF30811.1 hypothetical protein L0B70_05370 [Kaistella sp. 97-N-M2]
MKASFFTTAILALFFTSCKQTETKIETSENPDGSVTTTTVETQKSTAFDSVKINSTVDKAKEKLNKAGEKIDAAANKAGDELKKAGEDLKDATAKGAEKVEQGAEKAKEDLRKKD